jgi:lysophospholipase L1-like esterase
MKTPSLRIASMVLLMAVLAACNAQGSELRLPGASSRPGASNPDVTPPAISSVVAANATSASVDYAAATAAKSAPAAGSGKLVSCANIMPLGDSITLGVNGGYRNNLFTALQKKNCGVSYVGSQFDQYTRVAAKDHEGHPGYSIGDMARDVKAWLSTSQPDIILLMIGTNDVAWWTTENGVQVGARHDALIGQIQAVRPNAWIFVASIPPESSSIILPNKVDRVTLAQQLNAAIRANVQARQSAGQKIRFVDVNSVLTPNDLYDGIHPTEAAHARIAQKWLDALLPLLP